MITVFRGLRVPFYFLFSQELHESQFKMIRIRMGRAVEISVEPFVDCKETTPGMNDAELSYVKERIQLQWDKRYSIIE